MQAHVLRYQSHYPALPVTLSCVTSHIILRYQSHYPALPVTLSLVFLYLDRLQVCGRQDFASALEKDDSQARKNSLDIMTISVGSVVTAVYTIKLISD
jgi:hypothetical protein